MGGLAGSMERASLAGHAVPKSESETIIRELMCATFGDAIDVPRDVLAVRAMGWRAANGDRLTLLGRERCHGEAGAVRWLLARLKRIGVSARLVGKTGARRYVVTRSPDLASRRSDEALRIALECRSFHPRVLARALADSHMWRPRGRHSRSDAATWALHAVARELDVRVPDLLSDPYHLFAFTQDDALRVLDRALATSDVPRCACCPRAVAS